MQSLRDILPLALTPPHAHGTALITYHAVSYTCGAATLRACVPGVRTGLRRSPPGARSVLMLENLVLYKCDPSSDFWSHTIKGKRTGRPYPSAGGSQIKLTVRDRDDGAADIELYSNGRV
jgi:hypothetical protein